MVVYMSDLVREADAFIKHMGRDPLVDLVRQVADFENLDDVIEDIEQGNWYDISGQVEEASRISSAYLSQDIGLLNLDQKAKDIGSYEQQHRKSLEEGVKNAYARMIQGEDILEDCEQFLEVAKNVPDKIRRHIEFQREIESFRSEYMQAKPRELSAFAARIKSSFLGRGDLVKKFKGYKHGLNQLKEMEGEIQTMSDLMQSYEELKLKQKMSVDEVLSEVPQILSRTVRINSEYQELTGRRLPDYRILKRKLEYKLQQARKLGDRKQIILEEAQRVKKLPLEDAVKFDETRYNTSEPYLKEAVDKYQSAVFERKQEHAREKGDRKKVAVEFMNKQFAGVRGAVDDLSEKYQGLADQLSGQEQTDYSSEFEAIYAKLEALKDDKYASKLEEELHGAKERIDRLQETLSRAERNYQDTLSQETEKVKVLQGQITREEDKKRRKERFQRPFSLPIYMDTLPDPVNFGYYPLMNILSGRRGQNWRERFEDFGVQIKGVTIGSSQDREYLERLGYALEQAIASPKPQYHIQSAKGALKSLRVKLAG